MLNQIQHLNFVTVQSLEHKSYLFHASCSLLVNNICTQDCAGRIFLILLLKYTLILYGLGSLSIAKGKTNKSPSPPEQTERGPTTGFYQFSTECVWIVKNT